MKLLPIVLIALSMQCAFGQVVTDHKKQQLDSLFDELSNNMMSMAGFSVYENGVEVYTRTYGLATSRVDQTVQAESGKTLYRIGSVSKVFTAYLVMKLIEEGKLTLDQDISSYFPELNNASNITIRSLLSHKSLLPIYHRVADLDKMRRTKNEAELIALVNKRDANADTAKIVYNNLNYTLLGLIIEKTEGLTFNEVIEERLAVLPDAKIYGSCSLLKAEKNEANSFHVKDGKWIEDYEMMEWPLPDASGFLLSNPQTINAFMDELFVGNLLRKDLLEQMLPVDQVFGFGLMKTNFDAHTGYGHSGRIEGFTAATTYFPEERLSVTLLQNGTVYPLNDILILMGNILFDEPVEMPKLSRMELTSEHIQSMLGTYDNEKEGYGVLVDMHKG